MAGRIPIYRRVGAVRPDSPGPRDGTCDTFPVPEIASPDPSGPRPESLQEASEGGRLTSVVNIMKGRRSPISHLGVLDLHAGSLSLWDGKGTRLFAVPAQTVQARPARRRSFETHRTGFEVHADDRWWFLVAHVPTKYERRSTRELVEQYGARELAPRPRGMNEETYLRLTKNPMGHQVLWGGYWLETLGRMATRDRGQ